MEQNPSIKVIKDFLDDEYYNFVHELIRTRGFRDSTQGFRGGQAVDEKHKIRKDYTLTNKECSYIDIPLVEKANCACNLRERWRLLYYNGDSEKKPFRDAHTDWTRNCCHRRMSIVIGLTDSSMYTGGELVFKDLNLSYKIQKRSAVIFDSKLVHEVLPVTKGKRYVLQAFLFDKNGWDMKKNQNGIGNFQLLKNRYMDKIDEWEVFEDLNAIHSRMKKPEMYYIGTFSSIDQVKKAVRDKKIEAFVWHKPCFGKSKWAAKAYGFTNTDLRIRGRLNSSSWISEEKVVSGIRSISIKSMTILSTDGGPGNQIVGIKEGLLMSDVLQRDFIFPPIIQHYIRNIQERGHRDNIKYWDFNEIFKYTGKGGCRQLVPFVRKNGICKIYTTRRKASERPLRMETLLDCVNTEKNLLPVRRFKFTEDYGALLGLDDPLLAISELYNHTQFSNCFWNGCDTCEMNPTLLPYYKEICRSIDYSDQIKRFGNAFIQSKFGNHKYVSVHLRYPDIDKTDIKLINKRYNEEDLYNCVKLLCEEMGISLCNVFIATSDQSRLQHTSLSEFKVLKVNAEFNEMESFIEQYICSQSEIFLYSGGIHAKPDHIHLRSTWSSFVLDYRTHVSNKPLCSNIYLNKARSMHEN